MEEKKRRMNIILGIILNYYIHYRKFVLGKY